jgi:iron complex outermembrane receptor protein
MLIIGGFVITRLNRRAIAARIIMLSTLTGSAVSALASSSAAQEDLLDQPLESLSQIIISASKREESLIDAPMSASVLTADQIHNSGATSIPEVLRLVPGVIVREQANGVYDVHIRGFDNTPQGSVLRYTSNSLTLVMIDNRIVFNHYSGGTPWDALPIDLLDIERIEVVRGAAAALYGSNAVTGVIHVFTKDPRKTREKISLTAQAGTQDTYLAAGDNGFSLGENWSGRISANGRHHSRHDDRYYDWVGAQFEADPSTLNSANNGNPVLDTDKRFPDPSLANEQEAVNLSLGGDLQGGERIDLQVGYQNSRTQNIFDDTSITPFTTVDREDFYLNSHTDLGIWNLHLDYADGSYNSLGAEFFSFDYSTFRAGVDAEYVVGEWTFQPLLDYSTREYSGAGFSGDEESMDETAAGLRTEYKWNNTRLYAGVRASEYDFSDDADVSWLAGATHAITKDLVMRASYGRAFQEPFMLYTFQNLLFPPPNPPLRVLGNEDLDRVSIDTAELGLRWQIDSNWAIDGAVYQSQSQDLQLVSFKSFVPLQVQYQNMPTEVDQVGAELQLSYQARDWRSSIFVSTQDTDLKDQVNFAGLLQVSNTYDTDHQNTPEAYGGFAVNYTGINRWVVDVSGYWIDQSRQINQFASNPLTTGSVVDSNVDAKLILNTKISWLMTKQLSLFVNMRNLADDNEREFAFADETGAVYLLGFEWKN